MRLWCVYDYRYIKYVVFKTLCIHIYNNNNNLYYCIAQQIIIYVMFLRVCVCVCYDWNARGLFFFSFFKYKCITVGLSNKKKYTYSVYVSTFSSESLYNILYFLSVLLLYWCVWCSPWLKSIINIHGQINT